MKSEKQPHTPWILGLEAARKAPRCQAKAKSTGRRCRQPAVTGKRVCRVHGGAKGVGAPKENQNAVKHGFYTAQARKERKLVQALLKGAGELLEQLK